MLQQRVFELEPLNPIEDPARSPLVSGVWNLLYTGSPSEEVDRARASKEGVLGSQVSMRPWPHAQLNLLGGVSVTWQYEVATGHGGESNEWLRCTATIGVLTHQPFFSECAALHQGRPHNQRHPREQRQLGGEGGAEQGQRADH